jgi:peroxiredoxin/protocatechuate 3,4-dioxygenase beta subunit
MKHHLSVMSRALFPAAFVGLVLWLSTTDLRAAEISGSDLTGTVKNAEGDPVSGATVFIYTAAPKEGVGVLCPSCYADCRKRTTTDAQGRFTIESLDPALLFRVLVAAGDYQPKFVDKVDPSAKALSIKLKLASLGDTPDARVTGRVVNPEGKPVSGAVVNIRGVTRGESTRFGGNPDIDPVAVTDDAGKFVIRGTEPFTAVGVDVEARTYARRVFQRLATGETVHELKLTEGVSVEGRLVKDGKPVPHAEVGIAGADRNSEIFVGDYSVATDEEGQFLFVNLPPRTSYFLYGRMKSLGSRGSVPARRMQTQDDGSTLEAGDLKLEPAFTVAGEIRLTDGGRIPPKTRVMLSREEAWDTQQIEVDSQGKFRLEGVPPESVNLHARISGYRLSTRNASLDRYELVGRIRSDKTGLILEFEPGPQHDPNISSARGLREEPLRGAEALDPSGDIKVTGTVVDAETGRPLPSFTVTEGRADEYRREDFNWFNTRKTAQSNGAFTAYFIKRPQPPGVLIEAEGYLPFSSGGIASVETNLTVTMKKGSGPAGVLLNPDGQPSAGVTVYLTDPRNLVYASDDARSGKLAVRESVYRSTRKTLTDDAGRFSFAPQVDAYALMVVDDAGYLQLKVQDLAQQKEIRLQPWARVEGRLMIGSKPGAKESVRLGLAHLPYEHHPNTFGPLNLFLTTTTDSEGKFVFERVPPIAVEIYHEPKVRDRRNGTIAQSQTTKFSLKPGEKRELMLGGKGRPVVGRVAVNGYEGKIDWRADVQNLELVVREPVDLADFRAISKDYSDAFRAAKTEEEKKAARAELDRRQKETSEKQKAFYATDAGRQYHFAKRRYALNFSQDGSFRVEDVPGGKYTLKIDLREAGDGPSRFSAPKIGDLTREIEVPDSPGGRSDEPFNLGTLEMQARNALKTGKAAPDFEINTLAGKKLKLSDLKGKYVLLDFWAVWCGPCVAETPHLKETYEAFKDDKNFAMVGLSLDPEASAPRDYAKKNELGWIQGFLGEWSKTDLPGRYGVEGIPAIFLIGPDGKLVASGLRGPEVKSAVQAALKTQAKE